MQALKNKQILYLSYDGMTDPLGQSQVLPYLIGLSQKGYQFTLVSCEKKDRFLTNKTIIKTICKAHNIDWQPIFYTKKPPIISTIWDVFKLNRKVKKLYQQKNFSLIHCRSYIPALIGLGFKKKKNINFLFDMRGFWANERVDGNLWDLNKFYFKWIYNYFKKKEKEFFQETAYTISLTHEGKKEINSWNIKNLSPIQVIPCTADYNLFELVNSDKRKLAKLNLGLSLSQFVLTYVGSLGTWYMIDEMLYFFSILKQQIPASKFLFLTPDSKESILVKAHKYKLKSEDFIIKFANRKDIPKYAHASDFSIFFIKPAYSKKSSSPTKMGELMAMGIPLICNTNVGDVALIMNKTNAGFCLNRLDKSSFKETVAQIEYWQANTPNNIRENSKQFYDLKNGLNLYTSIYQQLI